MSSVNSINDDLALEILIDQAEESSNYGRFSSTSSTHYTDLPAGFNLNIQVLQLKNQIINYSLNNVKDNLTLSTNGLSSSYRKETFLSESRPLWGQF